MSDLPSAGHDRLATLADDIRALHRSIVRDAEQIARDAIEAGKLLIEAKQALEHGQWGQWLRENCDLSARTARRSMAPGCGSEPPGQHREALFWAEIASFTDAGGDLDALLARDDRPKVFHPFAGITEAEIAELRARLGLVEAPPHER